MKSKASFKVNNITHKYELSQIRGFRLFNKKYKGFKSSNCKKDLGKDS